VSTELMSLLNRDMDFQTLQNIINKAMAKQDEQLHANMKRLKEEQEKQAERIRIMQEKHEGLRQLELKRHRTEEHRFGFVSLSDLGQCFQVSIGAKTMGKLLRVVGLAKAKQSKTEPLRSAIINEYAKSLMYGDYPAYQWNPERCIKRIDSWLNARGLVDEFYAIDNEKDLAKFIKWLEDEVAYTEA
jgi:hypothetical protein